MKKGPKPLFLPLCLLLSLSKRRRRKTILSSFLFICLWLFLLNYALGSLDRVGQEKDGGLQRGTSSLRIVPPPPSLPPSLPLIGYTRFLSVCLSFSSIFLSFVFYTTPCCSLLLCLTIVAVGSSSLSLFLFLFFSLLVAVDQVSLFCSLSCCS